MRRGPDFSFQTNSSMLWLGMLLAWQGRNILGWFGPSFTEGYEAMLVIAAGASVNAMFSDSPYYLQFIKRSRDVFVTTAFAMVAATGNIYFGLWYPIVVEAVTVVIGGLFVREMRGANVD